VFAREPRRGLSQRQLESSVVRSSDVSAYYDDFADYALNYLLAPSPRLTQIRARLRPLLARNPQAALDIGCGIGLTTAWLAESVPRVVGIDISPRCIDIANEISPKAHFVAAEFPSGPVPEGPYDLVTMLDVLEHFRPDVRSEAFARAGELVTNEGVIAVNVPSKLFALRAPDTLRQVIDEALGVDEIVALAAGLEMEPLTVQRYGVDSPNQYVFCAFSRTYEVEGPAPTRMAQKVLARAQYVYNRVRHRRRIERLRQL
jgi:SAM-dependent methyltransferase